MERPTSTMCPGHPGEKFISGVVSGFPAGVGAWGRQPVKCWTLELFSDRCDRCDGVDDLKWFLGYIGDEKLPSYIRDYNKPL